MGNVHKFTEHVRTRFGAFSSALGGETSDVITTAEFVNMENYDLVVFQAIASGVASSKILTLTAYEATATDGSGSQSLTHSMASDTFTATATNHTDVLVAQVRGEELSAGFQYVGAKLATNQTDGTEKAGIVINQMRARYKQSTLPA